MRTIESIACASKYDILDALIEDGYEIASVDAYDVAATIQYAARVGALVWTSEHIICTLHGRPLHLVRA